MFGWVLNTPLCSEHINNYFHQANICQTNLVQIYDNMIHIKRIKLILQCNPGFTISCMHIDDQILPAEWCVKIIQ